jgi:hypothetical protein
MSDLFQNDPSEVVATPTPVSPDVPEDIRKRLDEKDRFIEQLKRENAEAREALTKRNNEQEFLDRMEQLAQRRSPEVAPQEDQREQVATPAVTPEMIEQVMEAREVKKTRESNLQDVAQTLEAVYGPDWKAKVQAKAKELGVGTQYLTGLGSEAPKLLYSALGISETPVAKPDVAPPRSTIQSPPTVPGSGQKDYLYWQQMKKEKGEAWYHTIPVQQQIWQAVKTMGEESFYSRSGNSTLL